MPCDTVRTVSATLEQANDVLLAEALRAIGFKQVLGGLFSKGSVSVVCDPDSRLHGRIEAPTNRELDSATASVRRAYAEAVVNRISKRFAWNKQTVGSNRYILSKR